MSSSGLTGADPQATPVLRASRSRVLDALRAADGALAVGEVAGKVDLHPNTARFHLDGLVDAGLALRERERRDVPGRPRTLYRAGPDSVGAGRRSYRLLAEVLASYVASRSRRPAQDGQEAGEAWGQFLAERPRPFERVGAADATERLVKVLDEIGFAPESITTGRRRQILLHHCPFRETAERHGEVICSVHLGLMRGVLAEIRAPIEAKRLDPFVQPDLCVAQLATRPGRSPAAGD